MGKDDQAYLVQRAAEEMAAAEHATSAAAARAHRELSLRYSLRLILPAPQAARDELAADAARLGAPRKPARAALTLARRQAAAGETNLAQDAAGESR